MSLINLLKLTLLSCDLSTWYSVAKAMSSWAISTLRRVAADLRSFEDGRMPQDAADAFVSCLEMAYRELLVQEQLDGHPLDRAYTLVSEALANLRALQNEAQIDPQQYLPPAIHTGCAGRPRFDIPQQQLITLVESGFTGPQMANILGVSLSTVRRRMAQFGLSISAEYATLSDDDLYQLVKEIKHQFPTCGCKQMQGHLQSLGYRIQQLRVREAVMAVDPEGSVMRRLSALKRRKYQVPAPCSLWHMDSNHKLIR